MHTYDLREAAMFLRMSPAVLCRKARKGEIKAAKPGKCWVFLEADLVAYLGSLYSQSWQAPLSDSDVGGSTWEFSNAVTCGGLGLSPQKADEYGSLLGLPTRKLR
jgi:hypothetical protein